MPYPKDLKIINRKLTDNLVIASCPLTVGGFLNFGARMALFNYNGQILVWSAFPYEHLIKALQLLTGEEDDFNVTHLIIANTEHTMGAPSFKEKYPNIKIIGPKVLPNLDIVINEEEKYISVTDDKFLSENFEFVYFPYHKNSEVAVYDKNSKSLFVCDLFLNLGIPGTTSGEVTLEQYSPETGFKKGFNSHSGTSFVTRYMQPFSVLGNWLGYRVSGGAKSTAAAKLVLAWDIDTIVMSHGNIITEGAKDALKSKFRLA